MKIAVIGSGIAGLAAAWHLDRGGVEVHLIEPGLRIGSHAHTQVLPVQEGSISIDTGFSVFNTQSCPRFHGWLKAMGVATRPSTMDVAVCIQSEALDLALAGFATLATSLPLLFRPGHWRIRQDTRRLSAELLCARHSEQRLGEYLDQHRYSREFIDVLLSPLLSAHWPQTDTCVLDLPLTAVQSLLRDQQLLHSVGDSSWQRVAGGTQAYLQAFETQFSGTIHTNSSVSAVRREGHRAHLIRDAKAETYDGTVFACDGESVLKMLADANDAERAVLAQTPHQYGDVYLHGDQSFMPRNSKSWSSRNVITTGGGAHLMTYWMNRIYGLGCSEQLFLTLNPDRVPQRVRWQGSYLQPEADLSAQWLQQRWQSVSSPETCFAPAFSGHGMHEDGFVSGMLCAESLLHLAASDADARNRASAA
ncbi:MAG: FAD-dependent oxidoreductase [bacterium]